FAAAALRTAIAALGLTRWGVARSCFPWLGFPRLCLARHRRARLGLPRLDLARRCRARDRRARLGLAERALRRGLRGHAEEELDVAAQVIEALHGDVHVAVRLGEHEGALEHHLGVEGQARGRPIAVHAALLP